MSDPIDLVTYGDEDTFKIIAEQSSEKEDFTITTSAMQIDAVGCVIKSTYKQGGNVSESIVFVPCVQIVNIGDDEIDGRKLIAF